VRENLAPQQCSVSLDYISVVIPNYNGAALLPACLDSLRAQTLPPDRFEVIVVDDASADDSLAVLARYPAVRVMKQPRNRRFAAAVNAGIAAAKGELIALLNNDVWADPRWLEELASAAATNPDYAAFASHIRLWRVDVADPLADYAAHPDQARLHSTGDYYGLNGVPNSRGVWQLENGRYWQAEEVFGVCAAAALYRGDALAAIAADNPDRRPFDERLVMYCEDADVNLRLREHGYRTLYVSGAVVYHKLSATGGGVLASYYCGRNFILLAARHWPKRMWARYWPRFVGAQLRFTAEALRHLREPAARARLRGQLVGLLLTMRARRWGRRGKQSDAPIEAEIERFAPCR
jgi:GT2 family glycosyltransferase